jgi:hypothetical protein
MGPKNHKVINDFISDSEVSLITEWVESLNQEVSDPNYHLSEISKTLNGKSCIIDVSNTDLTNYITEFQSISRVSKESIPEFLIDIISRISDMLGLPKDHIFVQAVDMRKSGKVSPHYDASISGYINYKCNVSVLAEDYNIYIGEEFSTIKPKDLYCFEASLYKHWTEEFNSRRIFLSFGFLVPYSTLNRSESDPRVRLSQRIEKYFQN